MENIFNQSNSVVIENFRSIEDGYKGVQTYTNKYGVKKSLNYEVKVSAYEDGGRRFQVLFTGVKFKYQKEYITYEFGNHFGGFFEYGLQVEAYHTKNS